MKPLLIVLGILFITNVSIAQSSSKTATTTPIPEIVKKTFTNEFPTIQPKWELDNKNYKAIYADPKTNSKGIIIYDPEGKVISRDIETNATVPQN